jgi:hypothetical protein
MWLTLGKYLKDYGNKNNAKIQGEKNKSDKYAYST